MATITIKLTSAGIDTDAVNIYTDADGYVTPVGSTTTAVLTGVFGYTVGVPSGSTICRVKNTGVCTNYIDITITT